MIGFFLCFILGRIKKNIRKTCFTDTFIQQHLILYMHGFCLFSVLNFRKQWENNRTVVPVVQEQRYRIQKQIDRMY